jgi:hypothetical protein
MWRSSISAYARLDASDVAQDVYTMPLSKR